jgi:hypothetical protein
MPGTRAFKLSPLIVLRAVGVARPEHQKKRLVALLEHGQNDACGHRGEIILLHDVGVGRPRRAHIAGRAVCPARRGRERKVHRLQALGHFGRQRDAFGRAGCIVDQNRLPAAAFGRVEDQRRAELADRSRAVALVASEFQYRRLVEVMAGKVRVHLTEDCIIFEERRRAVGGAGDFETRVNRIGEITGVAQHVAGRHP